MPTSVVIHKDRFKALLGRNRGMQAKMMQQLMGSQGGNPSGMGGLGGGFGSLGGLGGKMPGGFGGGKFPGGFGL